MFVDEKCVGEPTQLLLVLPTPSIAGFLAFCESKEPSERYAYHDVKVCACAQYAESIVERNWFEQARRAPCDNIWWQLNRLASNVVTFGALAQLVRREL